MKKRNFSEFHSNKFLDSASSCVPNILIYSSQGKNLRHQFVKVPNHFFNRSNNYLSDFKEEGTKTINQVNDTKRLWQLTNRRNAPKINEISKFSPLFTTTRTNFQQCLEQESFYTKRFSDLLKFNHSKKDKDKSTSTKHFQNSKCLNDILNNSSLNYKNPFLVKSPNHFSQFFLTSQYFQKSNELPYNNLIDNYKLIEEKDNELMNESEEIEYNKYDIYAIDDPNFENILSQRRIEAYSIYFTILKQPSWEKCRVISYNKKTNQFEIEFNKTKTRKLTNRLNICFDFESQNQIKFRKIIAKELQKINKSIDTLNGLILKKMKEKLPFKLDSLVNNIILKINKRQISRTEIFHIVTFHIQSITCQQEFLLLKREIKFYSNINLFNSLYGKILFLKDPFPKENLEIFNPIVSLSKNKFYSLISNSNSLLYEFGNSPFSKYLFTIYDLQNNINIFKGISTLIKKKEILSLREVYEKVTLISNAELNIIKTLMDKISDGIYTNAKNDCLNAKLKEKILWKYIKIIKK